MARRGVPGVQGGHRARRAAVRGNDGRTLRDRRRARHALRGEQRRQLDHEKPASAKRRRAARRVHVHGGRSAG